MKAQRLSRWISQGTCKAGYGPFRLNNIGHHSSRRYYRGGWHRSRPALADNRFLDDWTDTHGGCHSMYPYRSCLHCRVFAPAAPRRAWIRVSESISGLLLPARTDYRLAGTLHRQQPNPPQTHPRALRLNHNSIPDVVAYQVLSPVSRGYP